MRTKLVIFDMDGLIFDTERLFFHYLADSSADFGYQVTEELYVETLGTSGDQLSEIMKTTLGKDYPLKEISSITRKKVNQHALRQGLGIKKGLHILLKYLKEQQILCSVASSSPIAVVKSYLEQSEISSYFSFIIGGDQVKKTKPDPELFLRCVENASCEASEALVLEDSEYGILAAYRASIPVICVPDMKYPEPDYADKAYRIIEDLSQVIPILN